MRPRGSLVRVLGVGFGLAVTVGNTIAAGILRTPGDVAASFPDPVLFVGVWVIGALYALLGANAVAELRPGRTGNEVLGASLDRMRREGIDGTVYSHPVGMHGHGAGPLIGLWDRQEGVAGRGDVPIRKDSWYSTELQVTSPVPEWGGQGVRVAQEEEIRIDSAGRRHWILPRQERCHLIQ